MEERHSGSTKSQIVDTQKTTEGRYIYGIMIAKDRREFGPIGIGGRGDVVYTLSYRGIAAIISSSPITKYPVSRENMMTHAVVLDKAVEESTILPVRFCTIATGEQSIIDRVLKPRYQEFVDLLKEMEGKVELGVRAHWIDAKAIFTEIVEENKGIKTLKESALHEKNEQKHYAKMVKAGELVQKALEEKKKREAEELLAALRPFSLAVKENQIYGDTNLFNAAFLVSKEKEQAFDQKVSELDEKYKERMHLKYTVSRVPYNFVEVVIHL